MRKTKTDIEYIEENLSTGKYDNSLPLTESGLEGSCPLCKIGEVDYDRCDRCKVVFCIKCGGWINRGLYPNDESIIYVAKCKCQENSKGKLIDCAYPLSRNFE